jgi:hypothetical protein
MSAAQITRLLFPATVSTALSWRLIQARLVKL